MSNKNTVIAIILIVVAIVLMGLALLIALKDLNNDKQDFSIDRLFIVESNLAYGVIDANGKIVAQPQFSKVARINNVLYLKSQASSCIYNLNTKVTTMLDGFETDIQYIKTENGFLDKYILQYGSSDSDAIYRIIDENGNKITDKDFTSISSVYTFLGLIAPDSFTPKNIESTLLNKSDVVKTLTYPSPDGNSQYIAKKIDNGVTKYGIVDENNKQITELIFDKIEQIDNSTHACIAVKGDLEYVILDNDTIIETEPGFEFDYSVDGYVIQKRGTTGNKIYNLNGDVIIDKIFTYPAQIVTLNGIEASYLLMQDEKNSLWSIYDINTAEKLELQVSNLVVDYLQGKDSNIINSSFMYISGSSYIGIDISNFETFKINSSYPVVSPLDSGLKMDITDKIAQMK